MGKYNIAKYIVTKRKQSDYYTLEKYFDSVHVHRYNFIIYTCIMYLPPVCESPMTKLPTGRNLLSCSRGSGNDLVRIGVVSIF